MQNSSCVKLLENSLSSTLLLILANSNLFPNLRLEWFLDKGGYKRQILT